jgi:hypothetical protein
MMYHGCNFQQVGGMVFKPTKRHALQSLINILRLQKVC